MQYVRVFATEVVARNRDSAQEPTAVKRDQDFVWRVKNVVEGALYSIPWAL